jgi:hypothetical protein
MVRSDVMKVETPGILTLTSPGQPGAVVRIFTSTRGSTS